MDLLTAVCVSVSLLSTYGKRELFCGGIASSVSDVNQNISIDLMREDMIITGIYSENVTRSTKEKAETLMRHIQIYNGYLFKLFESYRRNLTNAIHVGESLVYVRGPLLLYSEELNATTLAKKFNWTDDQIHQFKLHYFDFVRYYSGINYYRFHLGYINNVGFINID